MKMSDGIIELGTYRADYFGFTEDNFTIGSYLWREGDRIIITVIGTTNPGTGQLSRLFENIQKRGFIIAVPTPSVFMRKILKRMGFEPRKEYDPDFDSDCEIWISKGD